MVTTTPAEFFLVYDAQDPHALRRRFTRWLG
jgi:hypothetical protein